MGIKRNGIGRVRRTRPNRNLLRLHLQSQVTKGGALPAVEEKALRRRLAKLFEREGLKGRRYERIISKRTRVITTTGRINPPLQNIKPSKRST